MADRSLLITGGTGSFGRAMARRALSRGEDEPGGYRRVIIFSRDEFKQHQMKGEIEDPDHRLRFFLGDVRDRIRLRAALRSGVHDVIHAAALKHVPAAEYNPGEAKKTNVDGAENLIDAAIAGGVERVMALSTDKACSPVNLYGATKLAAEKLFINANVLSGSDGPAFSAVRYGNVTGSRGSVVPVWREAAEKGEPLKVTDPGMTRFWMTIEEAVTFVERCMAVMTGGEVFVPELPAYRVGDLAEALAPGYPQEIVGIRSGEKRHESLISEHEAPLAVVWDGGWALIPEPTIDLAVKMPPGGVRVAPGEDFMVSSNRAAMGLGVEALREKLGELEP